jgi:hypothetical protein
MPKSTVILLFIIAIALAACQGQVQSSPVVLAPTVTGQPTAALASETSTDAGTAVLDDASAPPGCTVISPPATPGPTEQSVFPPVTDKDWNTGTMDAAITLIEYSDFQ